MYIIIALFAISCTKEKHTDSVNDSAINKKYFVKESTAKYVAENFHFYTTNTNSRINSNRTVKDITEINGTNNIPAYYIINYNDNLGYLLLSADYRQEAILGFNEEGNFTISETPIQLEEIILEETSETNYLRENEVDSIETQPRNTWETITLPPDDNPIGPVEPGGGNCTSYDYTKGPLLTTLWGQNGGWTPVFQSNYNDQAPLLSCGRALTGCVATAMAQIMYYHRWPTSYNWTLMQQGNISTPECARLMRNAGNSVSMDYGCSSSGARSEDVPNALRNTFGYSSNTSNCISYSAGTVQNEINAFRPVYLRGRGADGGHAWVCDGYRFMSSGCLGTTLLLMNWGWNGSANGFYNSSNWNPSGMTFNSDRGMILVRKN